MRFFVWLAGAFLVIILVILLILGITRTDNTVKEEEIKPLSTYANSEAIVSFTTSGRIVSNELHREIVITVTKNSATIQIIQGYQGQVISSSSFTNNPESFGAFLASLDTAGFTDSRVPVGAKDVAGQCALGNRFIYASRGIANVKDDLWSTSCGSREGTFAGKASNVRQLFQRQIPDYSKLTRDVNL